METVRITLRVDKRLRDLLAKRARNRDLGPAIRAILAESVGRPELAAVQPVGRPWPNRQTVS